MTSPDQRLDAAIGAAGGSLDASKLEALSRAAREELRKQPAVRPWWVDGLVVLAFSALIGFGGVFAMSWSEQQHGSTFTKFGVAVAWAVLMAAGSLMWLKPGRASSRFVVLGGFAIAGVLTLLGASGIQSDVPFTSGIKCAVTEVVVSVLPVLAVLVLSTRFSATALHVLAGALAASSGAALALHFHCSNGTVAHIVTWHLLPAVVVAAMAALIRARIRSTNFAP
ncbi:MAG: NrsF family protein [Archangium sp.]